MRRREPAPPPRNLLELFPRRLVASQVDGRGRSVLKFPRFAGRFWGGLFHFFFRGRPDILLHLDEVGSFVWERVDGIRSVLELSEMAQLQFGDKVKPVHERVSAFVTMLTRAKAVELTERPQISIE